jgi:ABC-type sugar transport system substrate-binding protein
MKKFLVVLMIGLLTASLAFAGAAKEAKDDEIIIGFNNGSTTVDFLRQVGESMVRAADEYGVKLLVAESNFDPEKILPNVDNLLLQGADIIVDFNVNAEIGGSLVDYCAERGVPVIGIDVLYTGVNGEQGWFFGANNQMAGEVAGKGLADAINAKWGGVVEQALFFHNNENGPTVRLRMSGMYDGMKAAGINITESQVEWIEMGGGGSDTTLVANQKMTDWLTAHPNLHKIVVGTVNTETGQGVFSAVQAAGRDSDVLLATNNNGNQTIAAMEMGENSWLGGVAYYPTQYGDYIIPLCLDILAGKNPDKMQTMQHVFLTRANLDEIRAENAP